MYAKVLSSILFGIECIPVTVESDVSPGMPNFSIVGLLSTEVRESRERVRSAIRNSGIQLPARRITVNLSPASIRKSGTGFDLPVAISIIAATRMVPASSLSNIMMIGEMNLNGDILPVKGALQASSYCKDHNIPYIIVPFKNRKEASLIKGVNIIPVNTLSDVISMLRSGIKENDIYQNNEKSLSPENNRLDFKYMKGNQHLRRALEIAVSGMHNILLIGPPGSGKTYSASLVPGILPPLADNERIEISKIYSAAGLLKDGTLLNERPFRAPHHSLTMRGLTGGGLVPVPGEITLSHSGVLFLDEILEFDRYVLETMRKPLEEGYIDLIKNDYHVRLPAGFMLIAASNPCPCGYYPDLKKCTCSPKDVIRYLSRLSGPLQERIDMFVTVNNYENSFFNDAGNGESSSDIQKRVMKVFAIEKERFKGTDIRYNSRIPTELIEKYCPMEKEADFLIRNDKRAKDLSIRGLLKLIRISRTIADLSGSLTIRKKDVKEGLSFLQNLEGFKKISLQGAGSK